MMTIRSISLSAATMLMTLGLLIVSAEAGCYQDGSCIPPAEVAARWDVKPAEQAPRDAWGRPVPAKVSEVVAAARSVPRNDVSGEQVASGQEVTSDYGDRVIVSDYGVKPVVSRDSGEIDEMMKKRHVREREVSVVGVLAQGATVLLGALFTVF